MMRLALAALLLASSAEAQLRLEPRLELTRADSAYRFALGLGAGVPMGPYLRAGVVASGDIWVQSGGKLQQRVEGTVRFLMDPLGQNRWGLSFAGGLGHYENPYLLLATELEGPPVGKMRPAFQLALGGGTRFAFIARSARPNRR